MGLKSFQSWHEQHEKQFVMYSLIFIVTRNEIWQTRQAQEIFFLLSKKFRPSPIQRVTGFFSEE
jgi:hypothetical protein